MQSRTTLISAAVVAVIIFIILLIAVPGVAAALGRWFGYVPGVGLVREGQIRVLEQPASVTRDSVTVTVDQVVLNQERTTLVYSVEGLPPTALVTGPENHCSYQVALILPDGSQLRASPNGVQAWASGYQHRFYFPPIPAEVSSAKLAISCLFLARPGAAPEAWEIPLRFAPAAGEVTAFPVIEIPTPTPAPSSTPTEPNAGDASPRLAPAEASPQPAAITLTLDRAVQMDDGYLIYATLHWQDTAFAAVTITDPAKVLHLLDAGGKEMLYETYYDEQTVPNIDQRQTTFAIKTAPVQAPGPLTLALDAVAVDLPVQATFTFDPGPSPKAWQTWELNQEIQIGRYSLRVLSAEANPRGYSFEMASDTGIINAALVDFGHPLESGGGGGGVGNPGEHFFSAFNYAGSLPGGPLTITVTAISVWQEQRLEAQWTPPAASTKVMPTQAAACLTKDTWNAARAQKPALPAGLAGRVLASGQLDHGKWADVISNLDGSDRLVIQNAEDGAISPDGARLAYSIPQEGLSVMDLATGQSTQVPGTGNGDFNPLWSQDGQQIVFNRGAGIFDLFITNPDGSNNRPITRGGVQEWPAGWLPDGRLLYVVPGRENQTTTYAVDVQSGASEEFTGPEVSSTSPDGKYMLTTERTFGDRWQTYISGVDGTNRRLVADASVWFLTPIWSPDGQWLLAGVSATDAGSTTGALVNPQTCQVIPVPALQGSFLSWVK